MLRVDLLKTSQTIIDNLYIFSTVVDSYQLLNVYSKACAMQQPELFHRHGYYYILDVKIN